ncbi:MAG: hypothetical protein AB7R90_04220 [Reyranellaceae bacterium]
MQKATAPWRLEKTISARIEPRISASLAGWFVIEIDELRFQGDQRR